MPMKQTSGPITSQAEGFDLFSVMCVASPEVETIGVKQSLDFAGTEILVTLTLELSKVKGGVFRRRHRLMWHFLGQSGRFSCPRRNRYGQTGWRQLRTCQFH